MLDESDGELPDDELFHGSPGWVEGNFCLLKDEEGYASPHDERYDQFSDNELSSNSGKPVDVTLLPISSTNDGPDKAPGEFTTVQTIDDTGAPASGNCQPHTREELKQKLSATGKYDQTAEVCITSRAFQQKTCSTCGEPGHNKTSCDRKRKRQ